MIIDPTIDAVGSTCNEGGGTLHMLMREHGLIDLLSEGRYGVPRTERRITDLTWAPRGKRTGPVTHKRLDFYLLNRMACELTTTPVRDGLCTTPPWFTIPDPVTGACTGKHTDHSMITLKLMLHEGRDRHSNTYRPKRMRITTATTLLTDEPRSFVEDMKRILRLAVTRMKDPAMAPREIQIKGDKAVDSVYRAYAKHDKRVQHIT